MTCPNLPFDFYSDQAITPLTASFEKFDFQRTMDSHQLVNDSALGSGLNLEFSYDGTNVHGILYPCDVATYDNRRRNKIFLRGAGVSYRFFAWLGLSGN